jgi:hypothetical protein
MQRNSLFDNPFIIAFIFVCVGIFNIFLPIHFISILLAGVVYIAFSRCLEKRYNYSLLFLVIAFMFIEVSQGLKIFSLSLSALFVYIFIEPKIKSVLSSDSLYVISIIFIFYCVIALLYRFLGGIEIDLISILLINFFIDIFIVSFIL